MAIRSLSLEAFSKSADNKRPSPPNCAGRRNQYGGSSEYSEYETSWPFSTFLEPTKRFVAL
jgi:hypothetical protein